MVAALVSGSSLAATVYSSDGTELKIGGRAEFRGDFIGSGGKEIGGTMKNKSRVRLNVGDTTKSLATYLVSVSTKQNKA